MAYKYFFIPALWPADAETELNAFLARHAIQTVDRQFIAAGEQSGWSLCVIYEEKSADARQRNIRKGSVDYREVLSAGDFDVFSELRRLRKQLAEQQAQQQPGLPPRPVSSVIRLRGKPKRAVT